MNSFSYLWPKTVDFVRYFAQLFVIFSTFLTFSTFATGLSVEDMSTPLFIDDWKKQAEESSARSRIRAIAFIEVAAQISVQGCIQGKSAFNR